MASAQRALELLNGLQARGSAGPTADHDFALTYDRLGDALKSLGRHKEALNNYNSALMIREKRADPSGEARDELARSLEYTGDELFRTDPEAASSLYRRDFQIRKELASADPVRGEPQEALAVAYERQARLAAYRGESMVPDLRAALALREKLASQPQYKDNATLQANGHDDALGPRYYPSRDATTRRAPICSKRRKSDTGSSIKPGITRSGKANSPRPWSVSRVAA